MQIEIKLETTTVFFLFGWGLFFVVFFLLFIVLVAANQAIRSLSFLCNILDVDRLVKVVTLSAVGVCGALLEALGKPQCPLTLLVLFFCLPEATFATAEKESSNRTLRYVRGRAAVKVSCYVLCIY